MLLLSESFGLGRKFFTLVLFQVKVPLPSDLAGDLGDTVVLLIVRLLLPILTEFSFAVPSKRSFIVDVLIPIPNPSVRPWPERKLFLWISRGKLAAVPRTSDLFELERVKLSSFPQLLSKTFKSQR